MWLKQNWCNWQAASGVVPKSHQKRDHHWKYDLAQRAYEEGYRTGRNAVRVFKIEDKNTCRKYTESTDVAYLTHPINQLNPYPTAFPYGNGMVLHFYQQQESSTTKTVHKVINKGLKTYV